MKKTLLMSVLAVGLMVTPIKKSHAIISGGGASFTVASALYLAGGAAVFAGSIGGIQKLKKNINNKYSKAGLTFLQILGGIVGVILMNDEGKMSEFNHVDDEFAALLDKDLENLSLDDISVYNSEVEELNSVISNIEMEELQGDGDLSQEDILRALPDYDISQQTIKVAGVLSALTFKR